MSARSLGDFCCGQFFCGSSLTMGENRFAIRDARDGDGSFEEKVDKTDDTEADAREPLKLMPPALPDRDVSVISPPRGAERASTGGAVRRRSSRGGQRPRRARRRDSRTSLNSMDSLQREMPRKPRFERRSSLSSFHSIHTENGSGACDDNAYNSFRLMFDRMAKTIIQIRSVARLYGDFDGPRKGGSDDSIDSEIDRLESMEAALRRQMQLMQGFAELHTFGGATADITTQKLASQMRQPQASAGHDRSVVSGDASCSMSVGTIFSEITQEYFFRSSIRSGLCSDQQMRPKPATTTVFDSGSKKPAIISPISVDGSQEASLPTLSRQQAKGNQDAFNNPVFDSLAPPLTTSQSFGPFSNESDSGVGSRQAFTANTTDSGAANLSRKRSRDAAPSFARISSSGSVLSLPRSASGDDQQSFSSDIKSQPSILSEIHHLHEYEEAMERELKAASMALVASNRSQLYEQYVAHLDSVQRRRSRWSMQSSSSIPSAIVPYKGSRWSLRSSLRDQDVFPSIAFEGESLSSSSSSRSTDSSSFSSLEPPPETENHPSAPSRSQNVETGARVRRRGRRKNVRRTDDRSESGNPVAEKESMDLSSRPGRLSSSSPQDYEPDPPLSQDNRTRPGRARRVSLSPPRLTSATKRPSNPDQGSASQMQLGLTATRPTRQAASELSPMSAEANALLSSGTRLMSELQKMLWRDSSSSPPSESSVEQQETHHPQALNSMSPEGQEENHIDHDGIKVPLKTSFETDVPRSSSMVENKTDGETADHATVSSEIQRIHDIENRLWDQFASLTSSLRVMETDRPPKRRKTYDTREMPMSVVPRTAETSDNNANGSNLVLARSESNPSMEEVENPSLFNLLHTVPASSLDQLVFGRPSSGSISPSPSASLAWRSSDIPLVHQKSPEHEMALSTPLLNSDLHMSSTSPLLPGSDKREGTASDNEGSVWSRLGSPPYEIRVPSFETSQGSPAFHDPSPTMKDDRELYQTPKRKSDASMENEHNLSPLSVATAEDRDCSIAFPLDSHQSMGDRTTGAISPRIEKFQHAGRVSSLTDEGFPENEAGSFSSALSDDSPKIVRDQSASAGVDEDRFLRSVSILCSENSKRPVRATMNQASSPISLRTREKSTDSMPMSLLVASNTPLSLPTVHKADLETNGTPWIPSNEDTCRRSVSLSPTAVRGDLESLSIPKEFSASELGTVQSAPYDEVDSAEPVSPTASSQQCRLSGSTNGASSIANCAPSPGAQSSASESDHASDSAHSDIARKLHFESSLGMSARLEPVIVPDAPMESLSDSIFPPDLAPSSFAASNIMTQRLLAPTAAVPNDAFFSKESVFVRSQRYFKPDRLPHKSKSSAKRVARSGFTFKHSHRLDKGISSARVKPCRRATGQTDTPLWQVKPIRIDHGSMGVRSPMHLPIYTPVKGMSSPSPSLIPATPATPNAMASPPRPSNQKLLFGDAETCSAVSVSKISRHRKKRLLRRKLAMSLFGDSSYDTWVYGSDERYQRSVQGTAGVVLSTIVVCSQLTSWLDWRASLFVSTFIPFAVMFAEVHTKHAIDEVTLAVFISALAVMSRP